jgi:prepilin-type N-terminal cleavage/methylation domain-containing protein
MKKNGFTFVELLVVITIIGVIFAAGIVSFTTVSKNSRNARRSADLEAIRQALEMCRSIDGVYPGSIAGNVHCNDVTAVTLKETPLDPRPCPQDTYSYTIVAGGYTLTASCYEGGPKTVTNP